MAKKAPVLQMYSGLLDGGKVLGFVTAFSPKEACQMVTDAGYLLTPKLLKMHWKEVAECDWGQGGIPKPAGCGLVLKSIGASLESVLLKGKR